MTPKLKSHLILFSSKIITFVIIVEIGSMAFSEIEKRSFIKAVYDVVKCIPRGRASSYGAIAKAIGYPNMSRMVGAVMSNCPSNNKIPAHRVVNSQGFLSGRDAFETPSKMQELLEAEGVIIINNKISNWKVIYWDPIIEISIE